MKKKIISLLTVFTLSLSLLPSNIAIASTSVENQTSNVESVGVTTLAMSDFTASLVSPQKTGTTIKLNTVSSGGTGELQTKFAVCDGTTWTLLQAWGTATTCDWRPTKPGTYTIDATVKDSTGAGSKKTMTYQVTEDPLVINSFSTDCASPQIAGKAVKLTTNVTGGMGKLLIRYSVFNGTAWNVIRDYSQDSNTLWLQNKPGNYKIAVDVKDENGKTANKGIDYTLNSNPLPLNISRFSANVLTPQPKGTVINLSMGSSGYFKPVAYRYIVFNGSTWYVIQDWSTVSTTSWKPSIAGTYTLYCAVRDTQGQIVTKSMPYVITEGSTLAVTSLTSSKPTPQLKNTAISITASATGGTGSKLYRFSAFDGTKWTMIKDYSSLTYATWTPTLPGNYKVWVDVKDTSGTVVSKNMNYLINDLSNLAITSLTSSVSSPQNVNSSIAINALCKGAVGTTKYRFVVMKNGLTNKVQEYSTSSVFNWKPTEPGDYEIYMACTDDTLKKVVTFIKYKINGPLQIDSFGDNVAINQKVGVPVNLNALYSGGVSDYKTRYCAFNGVNWSIFKDYTYPTLNGVWTPLVSGNYSLTADVVDSKGTKVSKAVGVSVTDPASTAVANFTATTTGANYYVGEKIHLTSTSTGANKVSFSQCVGGFWSTITGFSTTTSVDWSFGKVGKYLIAIRAMDATGKISSKAMEINVLPKPQISDIIVSSKEQIAVGCNVDLTLVTNEDQISPCTYSMEMNGPDRHSSGTQMSKTSEYRFTKPGVYTVTYTMKDAKGFSSSFTKKFTINEFKIDGFGFAFANNSAFVCNINKPLNSMCLSLVGASTYNYSYTFKVLDSTESSVATFTSLAGLNKWIPTKTGKYYISVEVTNSGSVEASSLVTCNVIDPTLDNFVDFTVTKPSSGYNIGSSIALNTKVYTPNPSATKVSYSYVLNGVTYKIIDNGVINLAYYWQPFKSGTYNFTAAVTDTVTGITLKKTQSVVVTEVVSGNLDASMYYNNATNVLTVYKIPNPAKTDYKVSIADTTGKITTLLDYGSTQNAAYTVTKTGTYTIISELKDVAGDVHKSYKTIVVNSLAAQ